MSAYLFGSITGRLALVLCVVTIALPYALRRNGFGRMLGAGQNHAASYLRRMWPHFWIGYGIVTLSIIHACAVMGGMGRANSYGILCAMAAFFLLLFEMTTGLTLREQKLVSRKLYRTVHFWTMLAFAAALSLHVFWNG